MPFKMASKVYPLTVTRSSLNLLPKKMAWTSKNTYLQAIKPLLWCMKICGLLPGVSLRSEDNSDSESETSSNSEFTKTSCNRLYNVYSIFVILILLYNLALSLTAFANVTSFDGFVCNQIITSMWFLQIAYCAICNYFVCKHFKTFCDKFDVVASMIDFTNYRFVRRCSILTTVMYIVWLLVAFAFTGVGSYVSAAPVGGPFGEVSPALEIIIRIVFLVVYFYFTSAWYLILGMFFVTCATLTKAFKHFNECFKQCFQNEKFKGSIETRRVQHEQLARLLGQADKVFSMYVMSTIGTVIPLIIFTLYFLLFESVDTFSYVATFWSAFLSVVQMLVIFMGGGLVNHEAHGPLEHIYGIDMNSLGSVQCHQVNVFLTKLTANQIGFTAFGLFTIDKPTIIAFASSIVTYVVVVIQFKPSSENSASICNCTLPPVP